MLRDGRAQNFGSCARPPASPTSGAHRSPRSTRAHLRLVHRRFRRAGPAGRQGAARRAGVTQFHPRFLGWPAILPCAFGRGRAAQHRRCFITTWVEREPECQFRATRSHSRPRTPARQSGVGLSGAANRSGTMSCEPACVACEVPRPYEQTWFGQPQQNGYGFRARRANNISCRDEGNASAIRNGDGSRQIKYHSLLYWFVIS